MSENYGAIYWYDKPLDPAYSDGTMLTGVRIIRKPEAVDIMNKQHEAITKQAKQIKILRNALEIVRPDIYYNQDGEEVCAGGIFTIDENGDADNESMQQIHEALEATKPVEE